MLLRAAPWLLAGVPTKAAIPNATLAKARAALATLQASRAVEDLLSEEPNYEGALCVWALGEAGADAALSGKSTAAVALRNAAKGVFVAAAELGPEIELQKRRERLEERPRRVEARAEHDDGD